MVPFDEQMAESQVFFEESQAAKFCEPDYDLLTVLIVLIECAARREAAASFPSQHVGTLTVWSAQARRWVPRAADVLGGAAPFFLEVDDYLVQRRTSSCSSRYDFSS